MGIPVSGYKPVGQGGLLEVAAHPRDALVDEDPPGGLLFFITLGLELSDTKVYEP